MKTTDARLALRASLPFRPLAAALTACLSVTAPWAQPSQPPTTPGAASIAGACRRSTLDPLREIRPTPWPGVFEVAMGANLAYVDASGQYFLFGHLYDMKAQRDLTAERKDTLARASTSTLPLADAIKDVRGRGSRRSRSSAIRTAPLPPAGSRVEGPVRRDDPHLPDADRLPAPAGAREGHRRLVREGSPRRLAGADDVRPGATQRGLRTRSIATSRWPSASA